MNTLNLMFKLNQKSLLRTRCCKLVRMMNPGWPARTSLDNSSVLNSTWRQTCLLTWQVRSRHSTRKKTLAMKSSRKSLTRMYCQKMKPETQETPETQNMSKRKQRLRHLKMLQTKSWFSLTILQFARVSMNYSAILDPRPHRQHSGIHPAWHSFFPSFES